MSLVSCLLCITCGIVLSVYCCLLLLNVAACLVMLVVAGIIIVVVVVDARVVLTDNIVSGHSCWFCVCPNCLVSFLL